MRKVCLVAVDLGYGHQRAAFPLRFLDRQGKMTLANNYQGIPLADKKIWDKGRKPYEFISRAKHVPLLGDALFWGMDQMQKIQDFYPRRNLIHQSLQLKVNISMIKKKHWGQDLIDRLDRENLPMLTTFFTVAYMAEEFGYRHEIYLVICDADVSRAWAAPNATTSKIKYLVPNLRVYERLQLYGVSRENIYFTGFPLPRECLGRENLNILRQDLVNRLRNLDPNNKYIAKYSKTIQEQVKFKIPAKTLRPLTITFAVGGAGAQREMGIALIKSLKKKLEVAEIRINLVAGIHQDVKKYFESSVQALGLQTKLNKNIFILYEPAREKYFAKFNLLMRTTDILWTKPSELCFYCALGLPVIITEPLGSQEKFNRRWLKNLGAGLDQENLKYANEWLIDWINSGWLAEAAMQGFMEAPKYGTFNIAKVINGELDAEEQNVILQY
ncbi:hypothetical protein CO134_02730 [Candidatus Kuenenbacteria bacterium CG_4_9_14_3_um_filter_39_14]|uniref:DUF6938 domain-containing protein n=7 Tax=Candidatus Kueneniibacteriota TaxID=1752740 RepID=A0A2M7IMI5_9BACT|nr:hypothetical protein [Candidatus Kuenenbacteria bacterium]OIP55509.1 MAG: hypothetical protein AUK13_02740 [Candidatus Kuenenbacteria bacterium CG2_30_39_24]PIP28865.1 MAG: hypothetical protein COX28_02340 [Candidatus Kuenenbacteria bacterium CG23_combo_of_CG06-09_8_20_14_all_39_39]PIP76084.1 MAG: hypothetical protein COW86_00100 [Candidatus Kuenenbacteria bacterium CG22_combo_CG10-13_8_21_14_all_39_9]PIR80882.1 MAG: hypothetical protein COU24_01575 [Candidatus Kuenenbacteria bacterium CG10_